MTTTTYVPATDKQISYAFKLGIQLGYHTANDETEFVAKIWAGIKEQHDQCSKATFSKMISSMVDLINEKNTTTRVVRPATPNIPAGRYALVNSNDHKTYFFKVVRPTEGRWAGYTFVRRLSSDNELRIDRDESRQILAAIGRNPLEAATRYGHEIKACSICHRSLTDEDSRTLGIGPVCLKKHFGEGAEDAAWDLAAARREAEQERAAYMEDLNNSEF